MNPVLKFLSSLRLAVIIIISLAIALAAGTIYESLYDLNTAWYWVYRTWWFYTILTALGILIISVAISRWPWKRRHTAFLMAHSGIVMILVGSLITQKKGLDGNLMVTEGRTSPTVEVDETQLTIRDGNEHETFRVPWVPPNGKFEPRSFAKWGLSISRYMTHADPEYDFGPPPRMEAASDGAMGPAIGPAIHVRLKGGPLPTSRDFWLWAGDPQWGTLPLGPARLILHSAGGSWAPDVFNMNEMGRMEFRENARGELEYFAATRSGKRKEGKFKLQGIEGQSFQPGWMGLTVTILKYHSKAVNRSGYVASRKQYGDQTAPSAVEITANDGGSVWLGEGEHAVLRSGSRSLEVVYYRKKITLPFAIKLLRFEIENYEGTQSPKSYSSNVQVVEGPNDSAPIRISMNEPLDWKGYTFYQSSFLPGEPRPTTSIFSVNRDPGRWFKYIGSILLVGGIILLFAVKYMKIQWLKRLLT